MSIEYELKRSDRKTLAVEIREDGSVLVRAPRRMPLSAVEAFLAEKQDWIQEKSRKQKAREQKAEKVRPLTGGKRTFYREKAREVFRDRTSFYAGRMGVSYGRIAIREQKTRWGSCSAKGSLNFNWKLILAPAGVLDYVVVHELAHRKEMNHSARFWAEVEKIMPDYRKYRDWLRENGHALQKF